MAWDGKRRQPQGRRGSLQFRIGQIGSTYPGQDLPSIFAHWVHLQGIIGTCAGRYLQYRRYSFYIGLPDNGRDRPRCRAGGI